MNFYTASVKDAAKILNTGPAGLDKETALQRLKQYGRNQLKTVKMNTVWQLIVHQLTDVMILVLIGAAIISVLIGERNSAYVILAIVVLNAVIGFTQEYRADKAIAALKKMTTSHARVLRGGQVSSEPVDELVPGDVTLLEAGNIIPADVRFLETHALKVDESSLTGESASVDKTSERLPTGDYALGDRVNMGYKGTFVTSGRARAYVVATGMDTELGRIAGLIQTDPTTTPLQKRLAVFGKRLSLAVLVLCVIFFLVGWLRGEPLPALLLVSISLAVAAIPEALPAVVTVALALGARRLVKNNALVRKLPAVETLGSVTYICTDKTGTLTLNKMTVEAVDKSPDFSLPGLPNGDGILTAMALNNDAAKDDDGNWVGDSTEVALAQYAADRDFERPKLEALFPRIAELPFDSGRKCMTTLHQTDQGVLCLTKGAVGSLIGQFAPSQNALIPDLKKRVDAMAGRGYRTLGYAGKLLPELPAAVTPETIESDMLFMGFTGLIDPPRHEARQAVAECEQAGIIPVMITGDHKLTAKAIAETLGIITSADDLVLTGPELAKLDDAAFDAIVEKVRVYARVDPTQKLRIISALQARHQFVAMTGDGVNDAPALKHADIGIAMGINGTEVAKQAAHMILLDDNFATIVKAVKHGRRIFDNILKFIRYILSGNAGEIWSIFLAPFLGLPIPLLAIHILWINLLTDGLPGLALAYEPSEPNSMQRPPIDPKQSIFAGGGDGQPLLWFIGWVGLLIGGATLGIEAWSIHTGIGHWQTMTFTVLCFSQLGNALAIRSHRLSVFSLGLFSNKPMLGALALSIGLQLLIIYLPFFNTLFSTQPLSLTELGITLAVSSGTFWAIELSKLIRRLRNRQPAPTTVPQAEPEIAAAVAG